jgi:hypothetical protein
MTYRCLPVIFVGMALQGAITGCRQAAPAMPTDIGVEPVPAPAAGKGKGKG